MLIHRKFFETKLLIKSKHISDFHVTKQKKSLLKMTNILALTNDTGKNLAKVHGKIYEHCHKIIYTAL